MANKDGWWSFSCDVELDDVDLEAISDLIAQGYTSGMVCGNEEEDFEDDEEESEEDELTTAIPQKNDKQ